MERRAFLATVAGATTVPLARRVAWAAPRDAGRILTVAGPVEPAALGTTLGH